MGVKDFLRYYSTPLIIYITPIVLLPVPFAIPGKVSIIVIVVCATTTFNVKDRKY